MLTMQTPFPKFKQRSPLCLFEGEEEFETIGSSTQEFTKEEIIKALDNTFLRSKYEGIFPLKQFPNRLLNASNTVG